MTNVKAFGWVDISGSLGAISSDRSKRPDLKEALLIFRRIYNDEEKILMFMDNHRFSNALKSS